MGFSGSGGPGGGSNLPNLPGGWTWTRVLLVALGVAAAIPLWQYLNRRYIFKVRRAGPATLAFDQGCLLVFDRGLTRQHHPCITQLSPCMHDMHDMSCSKPHSRAVHSFWHGKIREEDKARSIEIMGPPLKDGEFRLAHQAGAPHGHPPTQSSSHFIFIPTRLLPVESHASLCSCAPPPSSLVFLCMTPQPWTDRSCPCFAVPTPTARA